ncbi:MAG: metal-dependent hydrolase, partial [Calditrichia bacterium]
MFIGHYGVALAAKKWDSRPSLGTLFMASQFIDLLWPLFLLLGIEQVRIDPGNTAFTPLDFVNYPFSHSFIGVLIWAVLFGGIYYAVKHSRKGALVVALLVLSHWILDFITHRPDLPLMPGSGLKLGLSLWNFVFFSILLEGIIFFAGTYLYSKATTAKNRTGKIAFWSLIIFLVIVYLANIFGPPPPSPEQLA